jgi:hypothetical protein
MIADWDQIQIRIRIKKKSDPDWHQHSFNKKSFNYRNSDDVRNGFHFSVIIENYDNITCKL